MNARDKDGKTTLMAVAAKGDLETVRFLLDSGADVHAEAANGNTALQLAEEGGQQGNRQAVGVARRGGMRLPSYQQGAKDQFNRSARNSN